MTNQIWGIGVNESNIDEDSFRKAADTLHYERMGISIKWTDSTSINEFVDNLKEHINAQLYLDRVTNKWKLYLIRDDYDIADLISCSKQSYIYQYDFPLMSKIGFKCPCIPFLLWGRNIRIDRNSLRSGNLTKSINEGMMSCKVTSIHRKAKIITGLILATIATISLGSPQVLAYFSM